MRHVKIEMLPTLPFFLNQYESVRCCTPRSGLDVWLRLKSKIASKKYTVLKVGVRSRWISIPCRCFKELIEQANS